MNLEPQLNYIAKRSKYSKGYDIEVFRQVDSDEYRIRVYDRCQNLITNEYWLPPKGWWAFRDQTRQMVDDVYAAIEKCVDRLFDNYFDPDRWEALDVGF